MEHYVPHRSEKRLARVRAFVTRIREANRAGFELWREKQQEDFRRVLIAQ